MTAGASWFAWKKAMLIGFAFVAAAEGGKPALSELQVSTDGQEIRVSLQLENAFSEALLERLDSGLPTELTYRFRLYKDRKRWWDRDLAKSSYQIIAMYNAVSREYLVNYKHDGKLTGTRVVRDLEELERAMTVLDQVPIFTLGALKPGAQVLVRARVELGSGTWLFIFPTTETTDWQRSRKLRPSEVG
jgi:hypothetical protein